MWTTDAPLGWRSAFIPRSIRPVFPAVQVVGTRDAMHEKVARLPMIDARRVDAEGGDAALLDEEPRGVFSELDRHFARALGADRAARRENLPLSAVIGGAEYEEEEPEGCLICSL